MNLKPPSLILGLTILSHYYILKDMNNKTLERFWAKVDKTTTCWVWKASKRNKGYGAFIYPSSNGDIIQGRAHRFVWEIYNGTIPIGLCVLHKCDNPACVNPEHLFLGTKKDNNKDMCQKGRHRSGTSKTSLAECKYKRGEQHHAAKLRQKDVREMRKLYAIGGWSYSKLANRFDVVISCAYKIINKLAWRDII